MGLLASLANGVLGMADGVSDTAGAYGPSDDFWYQAASSATAGMRVSQRTVKQLAVVFACVNKKATTRASLPIRIVHVDDDGVVTVKRRHPISILLNKRPNAFQTPFEFKWMMQAWLELWGNACAEIVPGPLGAVDQLLPMHPSRLKIERLEGSGKFRYTYADPLTGTSRVLMQEEVFHLRDMCDEVGIGQSRIAACAAPHGLALAQQDATSRFTQNDSRPAAVFQGLDFETKEDEAKYMQAWQRTTTGENRGKIPILPPGAELKILSISPVDAQALETMGRSDVQLCSIYGVFPHMIGVDGGKSATFNSTEQFNLLWVQQGVMPMSLLWDEAAERDLIIGDFDAQTDYSVLLKGDTLSMAAFLMDMVGSSIMNADEARAMLGKNPTPDGSGKTFWNQGNWTPALQTERGNANGGGSQGKGRSRQQLDKGSGSGSQDDGNNEGADDA